MHPSKSGNVSLLVDISRMYYEHNLSQQEISRKVSLSRTYISKLLNEARARGIVQITIVDPVNTETELERRLRQKFSLERAVIIPVADSDSLLLEKLGSAAARLLNVIIRDDDILGVSWGATMQVLSKCILPRGDLKNITVVQLCGGVSSTERNIYVGEIPKQIAEALGGTHQVIPLPAVLDRKEARDLVVKDRNIARVLLLAGKASIAIFTVGVFGDMSAFVRAGYFSGAEVDALKRAGAVGDICSHIIDRRGLLCAPHIEKRVVAVSFEDITKIPTRIAVAAGSYKHECILAALRAGAMSILVTNEQTASRLLG
jgi:deoxyribonucleoside regulator